MSIFTIFEKEYEKILKTNHSLNAQSPPTKSIHQLESKPYLKKQCLRTLKKNTTNGFKIMRRLSFTHLLLIYTNNHYEFVEEFLDQPLSSSNQWLNEKVLDPYYFFMKKTISSKQLYISTKSNHKIQFSFEKMFYLHQLFLELFKIVKKMPLLGRYYRTKNKAVVCSFVQIIAVQAQKLYSYFKGSLQQAFKSPKIYLQTRQNEKLMKVLLDQSLNFINEQMKKLFLDKYFYPLGKGITIRLFKIEEQSQNCYKIIKGILNDHEETERRYAQQHLEKTIFPEEGVINLKFFQETLIPSQQREEQVCENDQEEQLEIPEFSITIPSKDLKKTTDQLEMSQNV